MNFSTARRAILLCRAANITCFLWGHRGLGKSTLLSDICEDEKLGLVDFRLSQIEASDLRGLPDKQNGRTVFLPPAEMPIADMSEEEYEAALGKAGNRAWEAKPRLQPRRMKGILFLDEANRGQDDVTQAIFQLVRDHRIGTYALPPGWTIVCAGNFNEGYSTNNFADPAFLDRYCHLTLSADDTTQPEWVDYMITKHGDRASKIIEFAAQNTDHLYGKIKGDLGFSIQPSPRSWEAVCKVMEIYETTDFGSDARQVVIQGLVGADLGSSFVNYNCPVKPGDLIKYGVDHMRPQLQKIIDDDQNCRNMTMGLMWGMASRCRKDIEDDDVAKVCIDFTRWLCTEVKDKDIAVAFANHMVSGGTAPAKLKSSMISNPNVGKLIAKWSNGKSFISRLSADPKMAEIVSATAWGKAAHI